MLIKIFNRLFFGFVVGSVTIGYILPVLFSARSNEAVLLGVGIIVGVVYFTCRSIIKLVEKEM